MTLLTLTISFISASTKHFPSTSMLQITLLTCIEIRMAQDGLLFFSFSISISCAALCRAILSEAVAVFLKFFALPSSFFSMYTCRYEICRVESQRQTSTLLIQPFFFVILSIKQVWQDWKDICRRCLHVFIWTSCHNKLEDATDSSTFS